MYIEIPYGRQIRFPRRCVHCLAPATVAQSLKVAGGASVSSPVPQEYTFDMTLGIPYCEQHSQQVTAAKGIMKRIWSISVAASLITGIGGTFLATRSGRLDQSMLFLVL